MISIDTRRDALASGIWFIESLDAVAGKTDELAQELLKLIPLSRQEPKCLVYDLYQHNLIHQRFTVVMCFTNQEGYDEHISSQHIKEFMEKFPDETLYTNVIEEPYKRLM